MRMWTTTLCTPNPKTSTTSRAPSARLAPISPSLPVINTPRYNDYQTLTSSGFGNVHGVYKPGNVRLHPELLGKRKPPENPENTPSTNPSITLPDQKYVKDQTSSSEEKPVFLVFHGGSGSSKQEYQQAISHGVVKVNLDTDLQYAYLTGIRDYVLKKKDYLMKQVGNPDGEDKPNKSYYDPRVWVREGEKTMSARLVEALVDFNTADKI